MNRIRSLSLICALALLVPVLVAGCGGDDSSGSDVDPQTVLNETFNNDTKISSGNLTFSLGGSVEGSQSGDFEAKLSGPFQTDPDNPSSIPQLDLTGSLSGEAAGQSLSFDGGLVITDDNAYVEYGGGAYEVGADLFGQFKQAAEQAADQQSASADGLSFSDAFKQGCEASIKQQGGDPTACEIDFEAWLGDLSAEGTEDIEGTDSDHVSGTVNVDAMLGDLVALGSAVPEASDSTPSEAEIQQVSDAITDASFDLYSATDDHTLRGLDFDLGIDPTQIPDAQDSGVESVDLSVSMRLGAVNEEQTIQAPSGAKPLEDLLRQFGVDPGSLGALGGLGGTGLTAPGGSGGSAGGGSGGANADAAQDYLDCVAQAQTPADINECAKDSGL